MCRVTGFSFAVCHLLGAATAIYVNEVIHSVVSVCCFVLFCAYCSSCRRFGSERHNHSGICPFIRSTLHARVIEGSTTDRVSAPQLGARGAKACPAEPRYTSRVRKSACASTRCTLSRDPTANPTYIQNTVCRHRVRRVSSFVWRPCHK